MTRTEIVLIRHGETEWNREKRIQGHLDSALTPEGVEQARACAKRLLAEHRQFDAVIASDLGRAVTTARLLLGTRPEVITTRDVLRERAFGTGEGKTYAEMDAEYPSMFSRENKIDPNFSPPGGESRTQFHERVVGAFLEIVREYEGRQVLVVTHGGVLGVVYRWIKQLPIESPHLLEIPNVGYNNLHHSPEGWTINTWGDTTHLGLSTVDFV